MFNANSLEDILIRNRLVTLQNRLDYLHVKVLEIFHYSGLDLTLPKRILESRVTQDGFTIVYEHEGNLYCTQTMPSGKEDVYGEHHEVHFTHSNEGESIDMTRTIGVDAVMVRNDAALIGLDPLLTEFALMEAQANITVLDNFMTLRTNRIIQAKDEASYASALEYEQQIRDGAPAVIMAEEFDAMEGINVHSTPIPSNAASQTIELFQYISSRYYSELGIVLNNNMKSQYVNEAELGKSTGMPLIYNMLACRQEAVDEINALFGRDIKVSLSEEWNDEMEADEAPVEAPAEEESDETSEAPAEEEPVEAPAEEEPVEASVEETPEETHSTEEVQAAADALIGEENEAADDSTSDDADSESDTDEDDEERRDVETEEDDDEG
nr:MAG TPA: upper collar protein [Caudoviricetes sp.]